jgi:hypothetical protein
LVLAGAALMLSGCVVGQKISLDSTPQATSDVGVGFRVIVTAEDQREDVLSGKQDPWRIGQYRAGAGIPWAVTTEGKRPLADQIRADLEEELISLGFELDTGGGHLDVQIISWDFTGYQNGRFWYRLDVSVTGPTGDIRFSKRLVGEKEIKGTLLLGARGGFERDMPGIYTGIIESMVRNNSEALDGLRQ